MLIAFAGIAPRRHLLDLMGQDMHRRLCHNDKIADHHTDWYNTPSGHGKEANVRP